MQYAVIMAGGAGTRLWPMSRSGTPKQLLRFIPGNAGEAPRSLLQIAAGRLRGLVDARNVYICTGAAYAAPILADLPLLAPGQLLGEPQGRDTANAVGFSAAILHKRDPDAAFAVLTADHIIEPLDLFQAALQKGFEAVEKHPELLVTFGITPTYPATGFGYVQRGTEFSDCPGVFKVQAFKEKPPEELARQYLATGNFAWNSGMFVWKARTILEQLRHHLPAAYDGLMKIADAWDTPRQQEVLKAVYPTLPKVSIDIAVMEKAPQVATIAMPVRWLDVGSWPAFAETLSADGAGNRSNTRTTHLESKNVIAVSEDPQHLIATINCEGLLIIQTPRATLVCPAKDAEKIKQLVAAVEKTQGKEYV
ncbi:MAG TPA: mannose-1-phosphate guanylyltransferase [Phycisphaerae bacterium]|nr:mannose-1-phosphate guanylyltransferase [Phycisphaerae bacterium]